MTTLNTDAKFKKCRSVPNSKGVQEDSEMDFYRHMGAVADIEGKEALEEVFLALQGFTQGTLRDRWFNYLRSLGHTGTIHDMKAKWWAGEIVAPPGGEQPPNPDFVTDLLGWGVTGTAVQTGNIAGFVNATGGAALLTTSAVIGASNVSTTVPVIVGATYDIVSDTIIDSAVLGTTQGVLDIELSPGNNVVSTITPALVTNNPVVTTTRRVVATTANMRITMGLLGLAAGIARVKFRLIRRIF